ncbi:class I SAM-dependent methyltransferase [Streptomyces sp. 8L]|uniref:class I SAM-dependent methyltransferase n=1 Tax=Streptomyces sp. 8L TaxID=2877242 RepID=UPI001CD4F263|nr:class I SAM-dependent methyltransferase [Streptomyces sp. 8L]MCA1219215.1 class I SAM-dependent methyltransferase [Streptomyces sp. 8L]
MTAFDAAERRIWAGREDAYAGSFAKLCAYTVPMLLDAARVTAGARLLDVGTGPGTVAAAAHARGARVSAVDAEPGMAALAARAVPEADVRTGALPRLPYETGSFDAVVANFVLNHVGRPGAAAAELRRVARPGGRVAVTIWGGADAPGRALLGRAVAAAGASRPDHLPSLDEEFDFPRTEEGLAVLLSAAGLADVVCTTLEWTHRTTREEWWGGAARGVATIGQTIACQSPGTIAEIRRHYDALCAEFDTGDGVLALPHAALLVHGRRTAP